MFHLSESPMKPLVIIGLKIKVNYVKTEENILNEKKTTGYAVPSTVQ